MTVNQELALLGVFVLGLILAAGFKLALSGIDMNSKPQSVWPNLGQPQTQVIARRPRFALLLSLAGWACLLLGCLVSLDDATGPHGHVFRFDASPICTFWLAMGLFLACFALCYLDYKGFLQFKQGRDTPQLRKGLIGAWQGLSILGLTGCVPQILILLGTGLARVFP